MSDGENISGDISQDRTDHLRVWIDQQACTGDGLCVQYAPEVFEFDVDGLAYVKNGRAEELLVTPAARADVPDSLRLDVIASAKECPGECIHVENGCPPDSGQPDSGQPDK